MEDLDVPEYYMTAESTIGIPKHLTVSFDVWYGALKSK